MNRYSTSNLQGFHEIRFLKEILINLAALNIILKKEYRNYNYSKDWVESVDLAFIDNGSGDTMHIFFSDEGVLIKGFDHESHVSPHSFATGPEDFKVWEGMYYGLPEKFDLLLNLLSKEDYDYNKKETTFCIWKENQALYWSKGNVIFENGEDDGSEFLLGYIYSNSKDFKEWADNYFKLDLSENLISDIFDRKPITDKLILGLNDSCDLDLVKNELKELGVLD